MLVVTSRTRKDTLAKAASSGTPLKLRLSRALSSSDLLRLFREHSEAPYGDELTELLLSAAAATPHLVEMALMRFPDSMGVLLGAGLSCGSSHEQLVRLARSRRKNVREHARLSLLSDSLTRQSAKNFLAAIQKARHSKEAAAALFIIATHRDAPASALRALTKIGPDFVRDEATRRLTRK